MSRVILSLLIACSLPGCATAPGSASVAAGMQPPADPTAFSLGPGDRLRITVFGEQKLSGDYNVSNTGQIAFPLIGSVAASGRTLEDVQNTMRDKLAGGYLQDPRVSVEVINYRPFYILGEVMKPGEYPYVAGLTLEQAIAKAGGYTYRAKRSRIHIKAATQAFEQSTDYRNKTILVQPGDTIRVPERFF